MVSVNHSVWAALLKRVADMKKNARYVLLITAILVVAIICIFANRPYLLSDKCFLYDSENALRADIAKRQAVLSEEVEIQTVVNKGDYVLICFENRHEESVGFIFYQRMESRLKHEQVLCYCGGSSVSSSSLGRYISKWDDTLFVVVYGDNSQEENTAYSYDLEGSTYSSHLCDGFVLDTYIVICEEGQPDNWVLFDRQMQKKSW